MIIKPPPTEAEKRQKNKQWLQEQFADMGVSGEEEALEKYKKKKLLREQMAGLKPKM